MDCSIHPRMARRAPSAPILRRRAPRLLARALLLLAAPCALLATGRGEAHTPQIPLAPCRLEDPSHIAQVEADCGRLAVPENPRVPRGRQIQLFVARVPAVRLDSRADPLFVLAGGPGMAASSFYAEAAGPLARVHLERDIILVDQRGTGRSNGLYCNLDASGLWGASARAIAAAARTCLASLERRADVAMYTTSLAVQDLDRVRAALGYPRIDLYGVSYGTRVAQHYLRRFPEHVRAVILDGAVPPQTALGASLALDAEAALERILARCARTPACHARFGDPLASYRALRATLAAGPVTVRLANPTTAEPATLSFTALHLAEVLRLSSYTSEQAALLPLLLEEAQAHGNFAPLAAQFLIVDKSYADAIADGMQNTVVCTEDVPFFARERIDRARLAQTFLGTFQLDGLESVCALWPRGPMDADFHAPLHSDTPVLILSGEDDPVTPPADARAVARGLTHHLIVELEGTGHGQLTEPCIDRLMAQFLERAATSGLDVACARRARPFPFFTSFAGPPP
jgi:pimeloyl-ACP methyl ester carboxylesterase